MPKQRTKKENFKYYKGIIESHGGKLISTKYINSETNIVIKCKNGHTIKKLPRHLVIDIKCNKCPGYYTNMKGKKRMSNDEYYEFYKNIIKNKGGTMIS